jgi:hypothetical protein
LPAKKILKINISYSIAVNNTVNSAQNMKNHNVRVIQTKRLPSKRKSLSIELENKTQVRNTCKSFKTHSFKKIDQAQKTNFKVKAHVYGNSAKKAIRIKVPHLHKRKSLFKAAHLNSSHQ